MLLNITGAVEMVGHLGNAPSVSSSQARRIAFFLVPEGNGGRDGCCPRSLLLDRQANMLLLLASEKREPGGSCNLTMPD